MSDKTESPTNTAPILDVSGGSRYSPPELEIGERIRKRRKDLDLSVEELAALTAWFDHESGYVEGSGISSPTLYRYESGGSKPGARELRILSEALNCSPNILLLGEEWDKDAQQGLKLASMLKALLKEAQGPDLFSPSNRSRDDMHMAKLSKVRQPK